MFIDQVAFVGPCTQVKGKIQISIYIWKMISC